MDFSVVLARSDLFWEGARNTLLLTLVAGACGLLVGILLGLWKLSPKRWLRAPADFFVWVMRGTPLLVQLLFVYYAVPAIFPWLSLNEFSAAALALSLNLGAYNAEVVRAGVLAVPRGQWEASRALGLSAPQTMRFVVLPQALRIMVPPLVNNVVALLKDSSLASSLGLLELSLAGTRVSSETFQPVPVLTTVALIYLLLTTIVTALAALLEKSFKQGRAVA